MSPKILKTKLNVFLLLIKYNKGIIVLLMSFGEVNLWLNGRKFHFNAICDHKTDDLPPQMTIFSTVISILMHFFYIFTF